MESIIRYDFKPRLRDPAFIECLPGVGRVGKISGDFLAYSVKAKRFATIYSRHFPPYVLTDHRCVAEMPCNELWYARGVNGRDVIFLMGDYQGNTIEGQFDLARDIMEILAGYSVSDITTLGGYGVGYMVHKPRVLGAVSDPKMKKRYKSWGVQFVPGEPRAGIIGASGLLLGFGKMYGIPSACLMGETGGHISDFKGALAVVNVLKRKFEVDLDTSELEESAKELDQIAAHVEEYSKARLKKDLDYIG